ncbi:5232_t:CDS:2, partial [Gigaspora margarita]
MLSDEILLAFGLQVPFICSIPRPDILNTNDIENEFVNYDISDRNEHQNLDYHIRMYAKQNGFVSIITCSESDDITCRRCRYACEHQDKYPDVLFLLKDLSDTIQSFKKQNKVVNEASVLLETLLNNKAQDPNWVVHWKLDPIFNLL